MKIVEYIKVPNTDIKLYDGSVVMLRRFPDTRWIVHNGWYNYGGTNANGWYFQAIPAGTVIPVNADDMKGLTLVSNPTPPNGYKPDCPRPPFPPVPPVPPAPPKPERVRSVEKYLAGVYYKEGQILYLVPGEVYQVSSDFRSSYTESSAAENLDKDIRKGYLKKIPAEQDIEELIAEDARIEAQIKDAKVQGFYIDFLAIFDTDKPSKTDADNYLESLDPAIEPHVGVYFKNSNSRSTTYRHVFTYYPNPNNPNKLIFIDDTLNENVDVSNKVDKDVAGVGGRIVKGFTVGNITSPSGDPVDAENKGLEFTKQMLSLEDGTIIEDKETHKFTDLGIASQAALDAVDDAKVDKISGIQGNIPVIGQDGNLEDSGSDIDSLGVYWEDIAD